MNSNVSIYIPRMAAYHTEETIMDIMSYYKIGKVVHVDFTPVNKKPGFNEYVDDVVKSAFVHFSNPINSHHHYHYMERIVPRNETFWNHLINSNDPYKLQISQSEYWLCLKNKNPVQRTMMNISQVVENGRYLENLVTEQAQNMEKQDETLRLLSEKVEGLHQVVYQLLLRLYNQETQAGILNVNFAIMYPGDDDELVDYKNTSIWQDFPTTRQGDNNEKRINELEKEIQNMRNKVGLLSLEEEDDSLVVSEESPFYDVQKSDYDGNRQHMNSPINDNDCINEINDNDDDSMSTHSSMPDLVECYYSDDSESRIRNSYDLCGNE